MRVLLIQDVLTESETMQVKCCHILPRHCITTGRDGTHFQLFNYYLLLPNSFSIPRRIFPGLSLKWGKKRTWKENKCTARILIFSNILLRSFTASSIYNLANIYSFVLIYRDDNILVYVYIYMMLCFYEFWQHLLNFTISY